MAGSTRKKRKAKPRKIVDESLTVRSKSGENGLLREEVWVDAKNKIVRYNLAYINFHLCQTDSGRVLGYDNAHGYPERHSMGKAEKVDFTTYEATTKSFYMEVQRLRETS